MRSYHILDVVLVYDHDVRLNIANSKYLYGINVDRPDESTCIWMQAKEAISMPTIRFQSSMNAEGLLSSSQQTHFSSLISGFDPSYFLLHFRLDPTVRGKR